MPEQERGEFKPKENALSWLENYLEATDPQIGIPRNSDAPQEAVIQLERSRNVAVEVSKALDPSGLLYQEDPLAGPHLDAGAEQRLRTMIADAGEIEDDERRKAKTQEIIEFIRGQK